MTTSGTTPLRDQHADIADYLTGIAKAAACDVLATLKDPDDRDLSQVADELRRNDYVSQGAALRALINIVNRLADTTDGAVPSLGDLSVLDDYHWTREVETILGSPLAKLVAPMWCQSRIAALRTAAQSWQLDHTAMEETLEEALYDDNSTVRIVAVDQLLTRWDDGQLEDLLARYDQQGRPYWYNVIAALDEHLYVFCRLLKPAVE